MYISGLEDWVSVESVLKRWSGYFLPKKSRVPTDFTSVVIGAGSW